MREYGTSSAVTRVLLADAHPATRAGVGAAIKQTQDLAVVGEAAEGVETLRLTARLRPDVLVLAIEIPGMSGLEVARRLHRRIAQDGWGRARHLSDSESGGSQKPRESPDHSPRILALSAYYREGDVTGMLEAGAMGYVLKDETLETIVAAIRAVAHGEQWYSQAVMAVAIAWARANASAHSRAGQLTEREWVVLQYLARGWTNGRIGGELGVRERTVAFHVGHVLAKLSAANRTEAVVEASRRGWLDDTFTHGRPTG